MGVDGNCFMDKECDPLLFSPYLLRISYQYCCWMVRHQIRIQTVVLLHVWLGIVGVFIPLNWVWNHGWWLGCFFWSIFNAKNAIVYKVVVYLGGALTYTIFMLRRSLKMLLKLLEIGQTWRFVSWTYPPIKCDMSTAFVVLCLLWIFIHFIRCSNDFKNKGCLIE